MPTRPRRAAAAIGFPVVVKVADPTDPAQDRPRAGAGRAAHAGGGRRRRRRLPRRAGPATRSTSACSRCSPASRWPAAWSATRCSGPWSGSPRVASRPRSGRTRSTWCRRSPAPTWAGPCAGCACGRCSSGYRGSQAVDVEALQSILVGVGQLVVDVPQVSDLDLNPLLVAPDGVHCVDVKVRLQALRRARRRHPTAPSLTLVVMAAARSPPGPAARSPTPRWSAPPGPAPGCVGGDRPRAVDRSGVACLVDLDPEHARARPELVARSSGLCWPTPAVKTTASTVPSTAK